jgi:hypothetical protein
MGAVLLLLTIMLWIRERVREHLCKIDGHQWAADDDGWHCDVCKGRRDIGDQM